MMATRESLASPRIFVVVPDPNVRGELLRQFRWAGWQAEPFVRAADFLDRPAHQGIGCVLLDVQLPDMPGADLHLEMISRNIDLPAVFLSDFSDVPSAVAAIRRGAVDFLIRPVEKDTLLTTVERALRGHAAIRYSRARREVVHERLASLTRRQRDVLRLVLGGRRNKQVAAELGVGIKTVKAHRSAAMRKIGFRSIPELLHALEDTRAEGRHAEPSFFHAGADYVAELLREPRLLTLVRDELSTIG